MARNRFVIPDTVRLDLSDGDFLIVKAKLNAGEHHEMFARLMKMTKPIDQLTDGAPPQFEVDAMAAPLASVLAYLIDWSFVDEDGRPVELRGQTPDFIATAIRRLDMDSYNEVVAAVQAHEARVTKARETIAANPTGAPASSPISTSATAGA